MSPHPARRLLLALLLAVTVSACSGDGPEQVPTSGASGAAPAGSASPTAPPGSSPAAPGASGGAGAPTATGSPSPSASSPEAAAPFPANTRPDVGSASGGPLTVVAVRASRGQGYDRVVLELAGRQPGRPGWRVEYVDDPREQGSGEPVAVSGEAVLQVAITGVGYPFDTGQQEATEDLRPRGTRVVREVVLGGTYEGQFEAFVGVARRAPFRVFRLADPARVVIDVQHR